MRRVAAGLGSLAIAAGLTTTFALSAGAAAPPDGAKVQPGQNVTDELPNAAEEKRRELREVALRKVLAGDAKVEKRGASEVVKVGKTAPAAGAAAEDQYVELAREKTDKIFVVLAEFGDTRAPGYPDQDTSPAFAGPTRFNGPLHNELPAPDRNVDNSTIWQPDYNKAHYEQMYFGTGDGVESVKTFYERQSSGRYSVDGQVTDWVKVQYNEARYGRSNGYPCAGNVCSNTWDLIRDAVNAWVAQQKAAGKTDAQIKTDLASYDQWDRYDFDHDGNFNEADGYIDHFQIVHSGGDQADGDPFQGEDAIWSHRWKAYQGTRQGPTNNQDGGTQIGATGLWIADYTIQPENGGISVFAHEYGHDLGLPDHYDTAGGPDNAVSWWTLMAQSRVSAPEDQGIGTRAADLGAWDKLQLGWLDYEIAVAGENRTLDLGPHEYNSAKAQGVVVVLPKKEVVTQLGAPAAGTKQWWSGGGDDYDASLTRQVTLPAGSVEPDVPGPLEHRGLRARPVRLRVRRGRRRDRLQGDPRLDHEGRRGQRHRRRAGDLDAGDVRPVGVRRQDGLAALPLQDRRRRAGPEPEQPSGIFLDSIKLTAGTTTVFEDGAEAGDNGWTPIGFTAVGATEVDAVRQLLHRVQPDVRVLRPLPAVRAVQLPARPARQGRALPVPERAARLLLGHVVHATTTRASTRARARSCRSTRTRGRSRTWTARCGAAGSRPTTRRSGSRSPTRSRSPRRRARPATSAARPRCRCSTTGSEYWDPALPTVGVKVPHAGVPHAGAAVSTGPR